MYISRKIKRESFLVDNKVLDRKQFKIIRSKRKNILVLAGAGSGKTFLIVAKVKYLIEVLGVNKKDILCISFTNFTTQNLKKDLKLYDVDVLTFHKLALKIIKRKREILTDDLMFDIIHESMNNDVLLGLYNISKDSLIHIIVNFIKLFKSNNYDLEYFYKLINKTSNKEKVLMKEIFKCYICYESYLNKEGLIDFDDMINLAIKDINKSNLSYKYIIIDEYQDISITKYELIKKLSILSHAKIFAVGDDFQSIYGFSGSNINLIIKFRRYYFLSKVFKLKRTYRNSQELIEIAKKFIMKNKHQINKKLRSNLHIKNPVVIVYYSNIDIAIKNVIKEYKVDNVLVLGRNNVDIENIKLSKIKYKKMTAHKSKGLQSDYVFVINVNNNANGFPNKYKDHPILRYIKKEKEYYPYEEERRLFYVALTRCKKRVFLFAPNSFVSSFILEIKKYKNVLELNF